MADDKSKTGKQDRKRVSLNEGYEVEDLHQKYPKFTHDEIKEAIKKAGPQRTDIEKYLKEKEKK